MAHQIKPSEKELKEAREIVGTALTEAEKELPMEQEVIIELAWTESEFTVEQMGGSSGFAKYPNIISLNFNTSAETWRESLRSSIFHEYAHTWDYEKRGQKWETRWEYILGEALTQHFARQNAEYESPWRTKYNREEIGEYWPQIRDEELDQEYQNDGGNDPLFINKAEGGYPNWLGYTLSYQIGEQLLKKHSLEELPELDKNDVIEAGNKLYSG